MSTGEKSESSEQGRLEEIRDWLTEHKLQAVGKPSLSAIYVPQADLVFQALLIVWWS
jgi:hypothetical protein